MNNGHNGNNGKMAKALEMSTEFIDSIRKWQELEASAIANARDIISKTTNPLIKMTMELIAHDSEKHRLVQQMIIDSLTKEAPHLSSDELAKLSEGLQKHVEAEAEALRFAEKALKQGELIIPRFLLAYLVEDEKKHLNMLGQLDQFKRHQAESSAGARR
ncbi:MAG: hypothetical protein EPN25_12060 [Nitrospirae bacterium]|nr:MAG: hypothetical protein EPN25_12060 [Nitrospirota bacterium]